MSILNKLLEHYSKQLPFVAYRKPNSTELVCYLNHTDKLHVTDNFNEQGFVFAPFDDRKEAIVFSIDESTVLREDVENNTIDLNKTAFKSMKNEAQRHIELVSSGIEAIDSGAFRKVVLSRKEVLEINNFDFVKVFKRLLSSYQNAFVYVWFHPEVGMWFGATPERLVSLENNQFVTMALAGTQLYEGEDNPIWGDKEIMEHQYVVDYIVSQIKDPTNGIILDDFNVSETYTSRAGNLLHLKADIKGKIGAFNLKELLSTLHPTPAVCGLPKEEAKEFILQNESYDRAFYSGFLGEMNVTEKTELFVNLRCAEYRNDQVNVYVGGGITTDSDPEKEWQETIAKTKTILKVL